MTLHRTLIHAATRYDRRVMHSGRAHNPYALAQYFHRIDDVVADVTRGAPVRAALCAAFTGSLLGAMLRAVGEDKPTHDELRGVGKAWTYQPVIGANAHG